ncbi:hypothetical protein FD37_GL002288 [Levilactobacillus spicheri DSM 15429]|uniref:Uncharacterized protein n=1 Tax=Levilactobacillus spicheri DSM 15429 TaxID=1423805 RepID=A0A0R1QT87_9LACO|nr:hypothetical protein FD37_GL002288 [Levilactobacillus spicheri DSM 15429]
MSLVGFLVINFLMGLSFVKIPGTTGGDFGKSTLIAVILYAIPIILAALDWKPSFYLMGLVIVIYSLGVIGMIINMVTLSHATLVIRAVMILFGAGLLVANCYWLVLALRLRKAERDARDRRRFGN